MKELYSKDLNRTNPLSVVPGGESVSVLYIDNALIHYDKIKNVDAYVKKVRGSDNVMEVRQGNQILFKRNV
jgi:hypothetical protein